MREAIGIILLCAGLLAAIIIAANLLQNPPRH